jgi:plasmid stabilization system protein ParE
LVVARPDVVTHLASNAEISPAALDLADASLEAIAAVLADAARLARDKQVRRALERAARAAGCEPKSGRPPIWSDDALIRMARDLLSRGEAKSWNAALTVVAKMRGGDEHAVRIIVERLRQKTKRNETKKTSK